MLVVPYLHVSVSTCAGMDGTPIITYVLVLSLAYNHLRTITRPFACFLTNAASFGINASGIMRGAWFAEVNVHTRARTHAHTHACMGTYSHSLCTRRLESGGSAGLFNGESLTDISGQPIDHHLRLTKSIFPLIVTNTNPQPSLLGCPLTSFSFACLLATR